MVASALLALFLKKNFLDIYISTFIFAVIGLRSLLAGFSNLIPYTANKIAEEYNWPENNSLQRDVASADIAFGIGGLLASIATIKFKFAIVLVFSICWIVTESIGILKILRNKYLVNKSAKQVSFNIFFGMVLDLIWVAITFIIFICSQDGLF